MKKGYIFLILLSLIITACQIDRDSLNNQIPESTITLEPSSTPTQEPTPTPTRIPLSDINLEEIVIKDGDLPAGYSGAQIRDKAPEMFSGVPEAQNTYYQQFEKGGDSKGGVTIFLYDTQYDIESSYQTIFKGFPDDAVKLDEIGEMSDMIYMSIDVVGIKMQMGDLLFIRCNAVVHIRMTDISSEDSLIAYAKRLDTRLSELVCP